MRAHAKGAKGVNYQNLQRDKVNCGAHEQCAAEGQEIVNQCLSGKGPGDDQAVQEQRKQADG